jgi:hypothetical protein
MSGWVSRRWWNRRRWVWWKVPAATRPTDPRPSILITAHPDLTTTEYGWHPGASAWAIDEPRGRSVVWVAAGYRKMIVVDREATVRRAWPS